MSSRIPRVLVLSLCALTLAAGASEAARRRPTTPKPSNPSSNCTAVKFVKAGTKASYSSTSPSGTATYTITWISDTLTQTKTTQKVTTPNAEADAETTVTGEVVNNLRSVKHIYTKTTVQVPFFGAVATEVDIDMVPSLAAGPVQEWCAGATWSIPPVTETITSRSMAGQQSRTVTTTAGTGEILAVGEMVTVPAGTFKTIKYKSSIVSSGPPQPSITWASMDHSVVVRQESYDANGKLDTTTVLTALQTN